MINRIIKRINLLLILFLLASLLSFNLLYAQTIITPSTADLGISSANNYLNCANINYDPTNSASQLIAITSSDDPTGSAANGKLIVSDGLQVVTKSFSGFTADVVIGNNISYTSDYKIAVVYAHIHNLCNPLPTIGGYEVYVEVYDVTGVGSGTSLAVNLASTTAYPVSPNTGNGTCNPYPHIDIIPDYNGATLGTQPICDQFIVSYTDPNYYMPTSCSFPPLTINLYFGINFSALKFSTFPPSSILTPQNNNYSLSPTVLPTYADLTATEFLGTSDLYLYYTYTDNSSPNNQYLNLLDYTTNAIISSSLVATGVDNFPRIDGLKNTAYNTNPAYASYLAVNDDGLGGILGWSNLASGANYDLPTYANIYPVVSANPGNGSGYSVAYYCGTSLFNDYYLSRDVNMTTGYATSSNYYQIDATPIAPAPLSYQFNAISSTCNDDGSISTPQILAAWNNSGTIFYKLTSALTAWRHNPTLLGAINIENNIKIYPNPTADYLTILKSYTSTDSLKFVISDILGREMQKGIIFNKEENLDVSNWASGIYFIKVFNKSNEIFTSKFVKK